MSLDNYLIAVVGEMNAFRMVCVLLPSRALADVRVSISGWGEVLVGRLESLSPRRIELPLPANSNDDVVMKWTAEGYLEQHMERVVQRRVEGSMIGILNGDSHWRPGTRPAWEALNAMLPRLGLLLRLQDQVCHGPVFRRALQRVAAGDHRVLRDMFVRNYIDSWSQPWRRPSLETVSNVMIGDDRDISEAEAVEAGDAFQVVKRCALEVHTSIQCALRFDPAETDFYATAHNGVRLLLLGNTYHMQNTARIYDEYVSEMLMDGKPSIVLFSKAPLDPFERATGGDDVRTRQGDSDADFGHLYSLLATHPALRGRPVVCGGRQRSARLKIGLARTGAQLLMHVTPAMASTGSDNSSVFYNRDEWPFEMDEALERRGNGFMAASVDQHTFRAQSYLRRMPLLWRSLNAIRTALRLKS